MNGGSNGGSVNNNNNHSQSVHNTNGSSGGGHVTFPSFRVTSPDTAQSVIKHDADTIQIQSAGEGEAVRASEEEQSVQHHNNNNNSTKLQAAPPPPRPSELYICGQEAGAGAGRGGSVYDYSFMSSCSLPSDHTASVSTPSPGAGCGGVTMRRSRAVINHAPESGRLLNSALARHFRRLHTGRSGNTPAETPGAGAGAGAALSDNLYLYLRDVFQQLDPGHTGAVSRQDFAALCEVLGIDSAPAPSAAQGGGGGGLQWLASYHPRPGTPASPIR